MFVRSGWTCDFWGTPHALDASLWSGSHPDKQAFSQKKLAKSYNLASQSLHFSCKLQPSLPPSPWVHARLLDGKVKSFPLITAAAKPCSCTFDAAHCCRILGFIGSDTYKIGSLRNVSCSAIPHAPRRLVY
jgi:hypothetical protein